MTDWLRSRRAGDGVELARVGDPYLCAQAGEVAALAKKLRKQSGRTKAEVGRKLGVTRATMQDAEERPEKNLTKLRMRIIKSCSRHRVVGPVYFLKTF